MEPASRRGRWQARLGELRDRGQRTLDAARGRYVVVEVTASVAMRNRLVSGTVLAGYLALRMFILLVPLAYLVVAGLGLYSDHNADEAGDVAHDVGLAPAVTRSISEAADSSTRSHWIALAFGLAGTLWAARAAWTAMCGVHRVVWRLPPEKPKRAAATVLFALGAAAALLVGQVLSKLRSDGISVLLVAPLGLVIWTGTWLLASVAFPHRPTPWFYLLPGALLFAVAIQGIHIVTTLYLVPKLANAVDAYGALGTVLVLLTWLVMIGWAVVLAAETNAGLYEWRARATGNGDRRTETMS